MSRTKYPELANYEWLYTKYAVEKLSSVEISKLVGCGPGTVVCALQRRGIPTRSCKSAASKSHRGFESLYLNDKEWLKRKYIDEKLTSYEVAKEANTNQRSVMRALEYHKINTRTHTEAAKNRKTFWRKYDILENKSWLYEQYITEKRTLKDIAKEIGSTQTNVVRALEKFKIKRRTNSEAQKLVEHKSDYDLLNNESFLKGQYSTLGKSTVAIANENGIKCCNSVRQALLRNNVKVRNFREGQIHNRRTDFFIENKEVIDGGLTGDASLRRYNRESDLSAPIFIRANKDYEHVLWAAKQLFSEGAYKRVGPVNKGIFKGKIHIYPGFRTLSHDSLMPYFKRWYPEINPYGGNPYEKIIPEDVSITPLALLHCFLDDGTTYQRRKESKTKQVYATLCLEGFYRENLEMYCEKIKKEYGNHINIKTRPYSHGKGYRIEVTQGSYRDFLNIIGPCPEELAGCMGYKWK